MVGPGSATKVLWDPRQATHLPWASVFPSGKQSVKAATDCLIVGPVSISEVYMTLKPTQRGRYRHGPYREADSAMVLMSGSGIEAQRSLVTC